MGKVPEEMSSKEDIWKCLSIWKSVQPYNKVIQIKTTMRYQFTLLKMAIFKKTRGNKWRWGCKENRSLFTNDGNVS